MRALARAVVAAWPGRWAARDRFVGYALLMTLTVGGTLAASRVAADDAAARSAAKSSGGVESPAARYASDPAAVLRGKRVFVGTCGAYCHSAHNIESGAPSLFDCEWRHGGTDEAIFKVISEGVQGTRMPAWHGALPEGDEDIWRIIAYLRSASMCGVSGATPSASASDTATTVLAPLAASARATTPAGLATTPAESSATAPVATTTVAAKTGAKRSRVGSASRRRAHAP